MANKRGPKPGKEQSGGRHGKITQSTALARMSAHKIASSDQAPLKIMLDNMMFWHNQSEALAGQIQASLEEMRAGAASEELIQKFEKSMKHFVDARQNAQSCAVDAAPYVHPKLASVTHKADNKGKIIEVETVVPVSNLNAPDNGKKDAVAEEGPDRSYRDGYNKSNVTPIRRVG